jgi:hypothetical protein
MTRPQLLSTILAALAAVGCANEDTSMCMTISAEAEACPAADDVNPDDLYHEESCDLEAVRVTGEGQQKESSAHVYDTGDGSTNVCCYPVVARDPSPTSECMIGRPFVEDNQATVAPVVATAGWSDDLRFSTTRSSALARSWQRVAAMEHASIAAFARLTLELMALGAPAQLVADVQRAAADEVAHARMAFTQASRHAGHALGAGPFPFSGPINVRTDLATIAADATREGCVGETLGAALAADAAMRASDPEAKAALQSIADDEARHAALSWRIVAWALSGGDRDVRQAVERALTEPPPGSSTTDIDDPTLLAHGQLGPIAHAQAVQRALAEVVAPAAAVLLAGTRATTSQPSIATTCG